MRNLYSLFVLLVCFLITNQTKGQNFITIWDLSKPGSQSNNAITFDVELSTSVTYKWKELSPGNDSGTGLILSNNFALNNLPQNAKIQLEILPTYFQSFKMSMSQDKLRLMDVKQWGNVTWTKMTSAFYGCENLQITATDVPNLSMVSSMRLMFADCPILNSPSNINTWNTENVTDMSSMFFNCYKFNQNIGNWNTEEVKNMSGMFLGAFEFNQNIGNWDTKNVTNMSGMFRMTYKFSQNLGNWDLSNVNNMNQMFDLSGLSCLNYGETLNGWGANTNTPNNISLGASGLSYSEKAKTYREKLTLSVSNGGKNWIINDAGLSLDYCGAFITNWNMAIAGSANNSISINITCSDSSEFSWSEFSPGTAKGKGKWIGNVLTVSNLPVGKKITLYIESENIERININNGVDRNRLLNIVKWGQGKWKSMETAFKGCKNMVNIANDVPNLNLVNSMSEMFMGCSSLSDITNIDEWQTASVTDFSGMFNGASSTNIDIRNWNTGNVTNMAKMFANSNIIGDLRNWNVTKVTNMSEMFFAAKSFDLSNWNTGSVKDMSSMFEKSQFNSYDFSNWNTQSVVNMSKMFSNINNINPLWNISNWNTSSVKNMSGMFENTITLNLNIISWDTKNVKDMSRMFFSTTFNGNIDNWKTDSVKDMSLMFGSNNTFNRNIGNWNTSNVENMMGMFSGAKAFNQPIGNWNTANVTDFSSMFYNANTFNRPIGNWNTSKATDMTRMFSYCNSFNQDISNWNTSNVKSMAEMFAVSTVFNQAIGNWNTGNVTNFNSMFNTATAFNQPIGNWNTSNCTNFGRMFIYCRVFNQPIGNWNTGKAQIMNSMFMGTRDFNQDISSWNTENVTDFKNMFNSANSFNQNIGNWNTISAKTMASMFFNSKIFNQDISNWNTANVTDFSSMFNGASTFNQNIGNWNTDNAINMNGMFTNATLFNQDLNNWKVSKVTDMLQLFLGAHSFNQNFSAWTFNKNVNSIEIFVGTAIDCKNYSLSLIGWAKNPNTPQGLILDAQRLYYGETGKLSRDSLVNLKQWTISGDVFYAANNCEPFPTSIKQNDLTKIEIYPNPSSSFINIKTNEAFLKINIYNLLGNLVSTHTESEFSVKELSNGIYILEIVFNDSIKRVKLIKN